MIPIFIPFVNRPDLLEKALDSVPFSNKWRAEVIDNSPRLPIPNRTLIWMPPVPLTFAQTQNWMLTLAEDICREPFYLFMHSDAEAGEGSVERLIEMASAQTGKWAAIFTAYDALAAFSVEAFRAVGGWDTNLSWYLSEADMYHRLRLAGYEILESHLPVKHEISGTLNADPYLKLCVNLEAPFRNYYYETKWGGPVGKEVYDKPFNGAFEPK